MLSHSDEDARGAVDFIDRVNSHSYFGRHEVHDKHTSVLNRMTFDVTQMWNTANLP
ncbi:MAG: hypothetical protein Q7U23_02365 [Methylococcales bacterium]|nr:hypothetical protein [Methylococcales bacterium]